MSHDSPVSSLARNATSTRVPRDIQLVFFISGASALIDQIVWTRALYRIFGVTAPATATVLATFMAGLAIGSWICGRWIDRGGSSLRRYALMELAIGLMAPLTPIIFRLLQPIYVALAGTTGLDSPILPLLRGVLCAAVLLPPTILMGGTLPVLAKGFLREQPGRVVASLYSINTWGAVAGCFATGYVLLGLLGETRSLLVAAAGNLVAAIWAYSRSTRESLAPAPKPRPAAISAADPHRRPIVRTVLVASFVNGFASLSLEVLWGRTLGLYTDASVYAMTCIIGVFLIGIALGSRVAGRFVDRTARPLELLGLMIVAMGALTALLTAGFALLMTGYPVGAILPSLDTPLIWFSLKTMVLAAIMVVPVTLLSGACFPFFARIVIHRDGHEGRELGTVYAVNTVGGILGAALAGFVFLPLFHDQATYLLMATAYVLTGAACLVTAARRGVALIVSVASLAISVYVLPPNRSLSRSLIEPLGQIVSHVETAAGTVTALVRREGSKALLVNGTGMTILCTDTKLMAHLPLTLHPNPRNVLVICFGMGTTFRSASLHPVDVTAVELQPDVPRRFQFFHDDAPQVLAQPGRRVVIGDGRNFLQVSRDRYSVITIDPAPPMYSAGTVNLYTREFFKLCYDHLDPDGNTCLWIPIESCTIDDMRLIVRTFHSVFDHCQLWIGPDGFGLYLIGSPKPLIVRADRRRAIFNDRRIVADMTEYPPRFVPGWMNLTSLFLANTDGVNRSTQSESRLLTDDRPYTEFPLLHWLRLGYRWHERWLTLPALRDFVQPPTVDVFPELATPGPATAPASHGP
ncbi:MAG: fused MFS/spermidine synthase [Phycisphaerae bacterium]|nr:fused MFS/spermidine synthase [Phycisphaerae bacterium]